MTGIGFGKVFYAKIVDTECEFCLAMWVLPQSGCVFHGIVSVRCQFCYKLVESKCAGFFDSIHGVSDIDGDKTVGGNLDIVFVPYLLGNIGRVDTHVLMVKRQGTEVEAGDIQANVQGSHMCVGYCSVDVELCISHGYCWLADVIEVVEAVAANLRTW